MSSSEQEFASPLSQFSTDQFSDDEIVWTHDGSISDTDFILLRHPLLEARSIPSTVSDSTGPPGSDGDFTSAFDKLSLRDPKLLESSDSSSSSESDILPTVPTISKKGRTPKRNKRKAAKKAKRKAPPSDSTSTESEDSLGTRTPTASYEEASAFISQYISSPVKENGAELNLLRALIVELGLRSPTAPDLPGTLTSARKMLKAEAHVNVKEYVATRHKGQSALQQIMKPSKNALRKDLRKGNTVSRKWVKAHGLQVLLITCFM